jgi:hypothetical protein
VDQPARWIRLDPEGVAGIVSVCRGFALAQGGGPVCLWGRASEPVRLDDDVWAEPGAYVFAVLVPLRLAPGRSSRWLAWGLSPVVAALRRFGARAYLDGQAICLHGARIGGGSAREIEGCAAVIGWFPAELPAQPDGSGEVRRRGALLEFDPWLSALNREGHALQVLAAFRHCLEVQHGWQFDTAWPSDAELSAITAQQG